MPASHGLIDLHDLTLPHLPDRLVGCRIAHLSDLHAWFTTNRWTRLAHQLSGLRLDLVLFTGDYAHDRKREGVALAALKQLTDHLRPAVGCFGVFGNHDHPALRQQARDLPITWLTNATLQLTDLPIEMLGLDGDREPRHDAIEMLIPLGSSPGPPSGSFANGGHHKTSGETSGGKRLRLFLHHFPDRIMTAADLNADLMFAGHTHGGQCRLPTGWPLVNCCELPLRLTSGILRHRNTLLAISRGVGSGPLPPRLFCKAHVPVYTLRRGPMPGRFTQAVENIKPW